MKKMKSLKGGLAGILFTAGLLAASCTSCLLYTSDAADD